MSPFGLSDHAVVIWNPHNTSPPSVTKKRIRDFSYVNRQTFYEAVSLVDWDSLKNCHDVQLGFYMFQNVMRFLFDSCFPFRTVRVRSNDPPWMNGALKILLDKRDRAYGRRNMNAYLSLRYKVIKLMCALKMII